MDKVLLINKPCGMTSFDVVKKCRHIFNEKKIGHTGTLDPEASGLLIVLLGKYTKYLPYCIKDNKRYIAEFKLGYESETLDIWGNELKEVPYNELNEEDFLRVKNDFIGAIKQIPPMYSAIKYKGKKLYEYARDNIEIEREPRDVFINALDVTKIDSRTYRLDAIVSSGTYIRSLIYDIANALNEKAVMSSLVRVSIEDADINKAINLEDLDETYEGIDPLLVIDKEYERVYMDDVTDIIHGIPISLEEHSAKILIVNKDMPIAIYEKRGKKYYCVRGLM